MRRKRCNIRFVPCQSIAVVVVSLVGPRRSEARACIAACGRACTHISPSSLLRTHARPSCRQNPWKTLPAPLDAVTSRMNAPHTSASNRPFFALARASVAGTSRASRSASHLAATTNVGTGSCGSTPPPPPPPPPPSSAEGKGCAASGLPEGFTGVALRAGKRENEPACRRVRGACARAACGQSHVRANARAGGGAALCMHRGDPSRSASAASFLAPATAHVARQHLLELARIRVLVHVATVIGSRRRWVHGAAAVEGGVARDGGRPFA